MTTTKTTGKMPVIARNSARVMEHLAGRPAVDTADLEVGDIVTSVVSDIPSFYRIVDVDVAPDGWTPNYPHRVVLVDVLWHDDRPGVQHTSVRTFAMNKIFYLGRVPRP